MRLKVVFLVPCQTCRGLVLSIKDQEEEQQCLVRHQEDDQVNHNPRGQGLDQVVHLGHLREGECKVQDHSLECIPTLLLSSKIQALLLWVILEPLPPAVDNSQHPSNKVPEELVHPINPDLVME